jgi:hypothetical protein
MNGEMLKIDCEEMRQLAEEAGEQMEVIIEMLIEAEEELCQDLAA